MWPPRWSSRCPHGGLRVRRGGIEVGLFHLPGLMGTGPLRCRLFQGRENIGNGRKHLLPLNLAAGVLYSVLRHGLAAQGCVRQASALTLTRTRAGGRAPVCHTEKLRLVEGCSSSYHENLMNTVSVGGTKGRRRPPGGGQTSAWGPQETCRE